MSIGNCERGNWLDWDNRDKPNTSMNLHIKPEDNELLAYRRQRKTDSSSLFRACVKPIALQDWIANFTYHNEICILNSCFLIFPMINCGFCLLGQVRCSQIVLTDNFPNFSKLFLAQLLKSYVLLSKI